jgi:hypothetical protein
MSEHISDSGVVSTCLGRLHVGQAGSGAPAVLWHSTLDVSRATVYRVLAEQAAEGD